MASPRPETGRLAAVRAADLLDTEAEEAFDRLADLARLILGTPFSFVTVVDETRSFWKAARGTPIDGPRQNTREESFCQYVVDTGAPLVLGDVRIDERTRDNPSIQSMGVVAWAGFPVHSPEGYVLGTFCVVDTAERTWSDRDVAVLRGLAEAASREVALRAIARNAEQARIQAQLLARIGELLTAGLDLPAVWEATVEIAVPVLADVAFVHSASPRGTMRVESVQHRDPTRRDLTRSLVSGLRHRTAVGAGPGRVATTGVSEVLEDLVRSDDRLTDGQRRTRDTLRAHSSLSVPLQARGQLLGVLTLMRLEGSPGFTDEDVSLAEAISSRAALALDNALAYSQQRSSSLALQRALLPGRLPHPADLELASRYWPAGIGQVVGGDWYDAFDDRCGATTLVIGDVAGHDIDAAAAMGQVRTMIRMAGHDGTLTPAGILDAVDTATEELGTSVFTSALIARVERVSPSRGGLTLSWSSAGHPSPVLVSRQGAREVPVRPGRALGLDLSLPGAPSGPARLDHALRVEPGQTLVLYTDGLVERRDADLDRGTERLLEACTALADLPVEEFCDRLLASMAPDASDDVALLVLRPVPGGDGSPGDRSD